MDGAPLSALSISGLSRQKNMGWSLLSVIRCESPDYHMPCEPRVGTTCEQEIGFKVSSLSGDRWRFHATRKFRDGEARLDDLAEDLERMDRDSAGQSGDIHGLSPIPEASSESVEELAATDQALEAESVAGVEDAADHPGRPVHTHDEYGRPDETPPKDDSE